MPDVSLQGKPYQAALNDDINEVINTFRYYGSWADKISGQTINTHSPKDKLVYTICQPMGVVAQIIPWNFPLAMAAMKLGPALACGNTVILKPSEQSPLSILYLATLIQEAGFPPGVVNILNGLGRVAGACLAGHPGVDMVAFTGSTGTGKEIMRMAAGTLKEIILETGGKSPLVVFEDADLEQAVKWACFGCMYNQGQICTATSRLLVHETVIQKFLVLFKEQVDSIQVGDPFDKNTFQGPLISKSQLERVRAYIDAGKSEGANIVAGGKLIPGRGFYVTPTIFADVTEDMRIWQEEIFGPVAAVKTFSTEEEAVASANNTSYGLGAAVFTSDIQRAHRVAANIDAGTVWINSSNDSDIRVPFGGVKQSGIGRELGEAGLQAYLQVKAVHVNLGCSL
jgi:aldehyde dehydrogenase (NAD(P)+)